MLYELLRQVRVPCLCDADALNLIAKKPGWWDEIQTEMIITPHLGEMSRLTGQPISEIHDALVETATDFSKEHQITVVLKDAHTVTVNKSGSCFLNLSGNHGMATAGSGDVLSGMIGALLAQHVEPKIAAPLGVFIHGLAGDAAVPKCGHYAMMASDIVEGIIDVSRKQEDTKK